MKAGTSSLHSYLAQHPEICMSHPKEPEFFVEKKNWSRGLEWYQSCFPAARQHRAIGEASTNYSKAPFFPGVAERIFSVLGSIKLIYLVRDPVERVLSHYVHAVSVGAETASFEQALRDPAKAPGYLHISRYYSQIEKFFPYFPPEKILIADSAELLSKRNETMNRIFAFLGVASSFHNFTNLANQSANYLQQNTLGKIFCKKPAGWSPPLKASTPWGRFLQQAVMKPITRPAISSSSRQMLLDYFAEDVKKLREFSGQAFPSWSV